MPGYNIVYIIGFMGSGKTTAGRKLANFLEWNFIDLDEEIIRQEGKTISAVFADSGEEYFRKIESATLRDLNLTKDTIVSVGGGAPCFPGNIGYMKETGLVVYLKKTPEQLISRLSRDRGKRPLLREIPEGGLLDFIREKLNGREEFYNKADLLITGMDTDIPGLAAKVSYALKK